MIELTKQEKEIIASAGMGRRVGIGSHPALIVVDAQVYMMGDEREPIEQSCKKYPSSCGERAWDAAGKIRELIDAFHELGLPVAYTYLALKADGSDAGPFRMKRDFIAADNWMIEGTHGAEIASMLTPQAQDFVFAKKRPSAFFKTPLHDYLQKRKVDTTVIVGGSTSNCVRATVFDSASYDYRTILAADALMDRMAESHKVSLRDMDRQFADVMTTEEILAVLCSR